MACSKLISFILMVKKKNKSQLRSYTKLYFLSTDVLLGLRLKCVLQYSEILLDTSSI